MLDVALHKTPRIVQRQWRSGPNALSFERFVPTLRLPVRLPILGRRADVGDAGDPGEFLEVPSQELRAAVGNDAGQERPGVALWHAAK